MDETTDPLGILTKPTSAPVEETGGGGDPLGILKKKAEPESALVSSKDSPGLSGLQQKLSEKNTQSDLSSNPDERATQLENQYQVRMMQYQTAKEDADKAMADAFRNGNELASVPTKERAAQDAALKKKSIADNILKEAEAIRSGKYTDAQKKEIALDVIEGKRDTQDPISALVNTVKSGIADQLPKEYYVQRLRMSKGSFGDLFDPRSDLNAFGDKLPKGISREDFYQWNNAQPDDIRTKSYDDRAKLFITSRLGKDGFERLKSQFIESNTQERLGFEKEIQQQNVEAGVRTKGVVQSLKDVHGAMDFLNFAGNMLGQAAYRAPTSILSGTMGSVVAESSTIYDRQLDLIAQKEGISREEVIARGLDKPAEGQALAVLAGTLDAASSANLMGLFRNAVKKQLTEGMVKQFAKAAIKGAIPEAITEAAQGEIEELAAAKGAGTQYTPDIERIATSAVGGAIGGGVIGGVTSVNPVAKVVQEQRQIINPENPESIEAASKKIEDALNENVGKYTFDKPIQKKATTVESGGLLQYSQEGTGVAGSVSGPLEPGIQGEKVAQESTNKDQTQIAERVDISTGADSGTIEFKEPSETQPQTNENKPPSSPEQPGPSVNEPTEQSSGPTEPPIPTDQPPASNQDAVGGTKTYAIAKRILASDANEAIKRGVKEKGAEYVPKGINITDKEANQLIDLYGEDKAESLVKDTKSDLSGDNRTAIAARLYERYKDRADSATGPEQKKHFYDKAVNIALTSAEQLKEAGRQTNAAKIWKAITQYEDMTVLAIEKENQRQSQKLIEPIAQQVHQSRTDFDEQVRRIIAQKVTEGVEANLKRAKLISAEKRKQISDAFDKLKIQKPKDTLQASILLPEIYNGAIEAVKRAVLAGADVANAVQAGVDYIRDNFKGQWDEDEFKNTISPTVESMIPKEPINPKDIDENAIKTPKLSGRKKKDFINQAVDAYNEGKLTDEKFEQLYAKQLGAKEFTSDERQIIRGLAKTIANVEKFESEVKVNFTRENIAKYKSLLLEAQKANDELQQFAQKPNNLWDTLISIMQGNLLTPLSLITNIYSNIALQPLRFLSTGIGSFVDFGVSQIAKTSLLADSYRDQTIDMVELQKGYFEGNWNGLIEGLNQLKTGPRSSERAVRELSSQFSPVKAIARWSDKNRPLAQKINDYVEGTVGMPAEVMFRLLNLGDKPFRRGAELARALEIAKQKGLKGMDLEKFIIFPDDASAELIKKAGDEATFQQDSKSAKFVQEIMTKIVNSIGKVPVIGGPLKVLAKSQIPYVKTPWNIMTETLQYAAFPVTGLIGIRQIAQGDKRAGSILIGKAIVGAMIFAVAKGLFSQGLLSWDEPYDQKKGKQRERRQIQYDNIPPNSLNVSAIQRGMIGEGFNIKDDDAWIDYSKLGVMGLLFDNYANNYFSNIQEKGQMPEESEFYVDMLTTAPRLLSQSLEQSFLKGTNTLLSAIQDGGGHEMNQWLISTSGAISAIVYPNTLSTISKSSDEFIRDINDDSFAEKLKNTYKTKFFIGDQLPPKVNLWGEKITGNPDGRNKYAYYLFDPTKFKNVDTDNFKYRLYEAWKTDKFNDDWLPSIPKREVSYRGVKIPLNSEQYAKYSEYVGLERARLVSTYVNSAGFERKDKEKVLKKLEDLYGAGRERGKKKFLMEMGWNILRPAKLSQIGKKQ